MIRLAVLVFLSEFVGSAVSFVPKRSSVTVEYNIPLASTSTHITETPERTNKGSVDFDAWRNGFCTVEREECYELSGNFPSDLKGTFFQNGASKFHIGRDLVKHPFDGDGMIKAVTFREGKAWFRNRYVQTAGYLKELEHNRILYRGLFGTSKGKGSWWENIMDLRLKNLANTHVLYTNEKLYALWEGGRPYAMDPTTLETTNPGIESDLGLLDKGDNYAAHYKIDPITGTIVTFGVGVVLGLDPNEAHDLMLLEHDDKLNLVSKRVFRLPGFGLAHDCSITPNYAVFFQAAMKFNPVPAILGQKGIAQSIENDDKATESNLFLVPRGAKGEPITIKLPTAFNFHIANAFERHDGNVVVDVVATDRVFMGDTTQAPEVPVWESITENNYNSTVPSYALTRVIVDPSTHELVSFTKMSQDDSRNVDFPIVHPNYVGQPYKFAFCSATASTDTNMPLQGLIKVDVEEGKTVQKWFPPEDHEFLSELAFAPRSDQEDDGYLLGYLLNGRDKSTQLVVFDAKNIEKGPLVASHLKQFMPHALHGTFVPGFAPVLSPDIKDSFLPK